VPFSRGFKEIAEFSAERSALRIKSDGALLLRRHCADYTRALNIVKCYFSVFNPNVRKNKEKQAPAKGLPSRSFLEKLAVNSGSSGP